MLLSLNTSRPASQPSGQLLGNGLRRLFASYECWILQLRYVANTTSVNVLAYSWSPNLQRSSAYAGPANRAINSRMGKSVLGTLRIQRA